MCQANPKTHQFHSIQLGMTQYETVNAHTKDGRLKKTSL